MSNQLKSHEQLSTLTQWLYYLETIHFKEIDLGLTRIKQVAERLSIDFSFAQVITVAGTNGKGTTCAFLENALLSEGNSVAVYSSPHLEYFNERLRINQIDIDDESIITAFKQIELARNEISLSYYEYTTLAAFLVLMVNKPQIIILEVGLGGRLDATNIIDTNLAIITTIDIDHTSFLGNDRESIGVEKAGIMRENTIAIIGDCHPPQSVLDYSKEINANTYIRNIDFNINFNTCNNNIDHKKKWCWYQQDTHLVELSYPHIPIDNVATALMALQLLGVEFTSKKINSWINVTKVVGRMELFSYALNKNINKRGSYNCDIIFDVAHNPQAARYLAEQLSYYPYTKIHAVVAMMADKDILAALAPLTEMIDNWYLGDLTIERAATSNVVANKLSLLNQECFCFDNIKDAFKMACKHSKSDELVLVFGSFFTVAAIRPLLVS